MNANLANQQLNIQQFETELKGNILPFWMQQAPDRDNGGFYGAISNDLQIHNEVERSAVLCGRILWTFSTAASLYGDEAYLSTARRAFDDLSGRFWDKKQRGVYWSIDKHGQPINERKHTYAQSFSIYGLSTYYRATGEPKSLALAKRLFELVETHTFDPLNGGNLECRARDWSTLNDMRLSTIDVDSPKSMNTLLHLMEAYASLLQVWPDKTLTEKLRGLVQVFLEHVIEPDSSHQRLFFDEHWNSLTRAISYGHDIETSWLLVEAAEVLNDRTLLSQARSKSVAMAQAVYDQALGPDGSILYELDPVEHSKDDRRHWWAHAEAVVGFYNAYQLSGQPNFAQASEKVWDYIRAHFIDRQNGDWFKLLTPDGEPILEHYKVGPWECPYHHARMCYEMIRRGKGEHQELAD